MEDFEDMEIDEDISFPKTLRKYQKSLVEKCMNENCIILLPTGTGKTLIAFQVIENLSGSLAGDYPAAQRSIFLAPTKVLVEQQEKQFTKFSNNLSSVFLHGDHNVDFFTAEEWEGYFKQYQVLFFTPQAFLSKIYSFFI